MSEKLRTIIADALRYDLEKSVNEIWESPEFRAMGSEIERAFAAYMIIGSKRLNGIDIRLEMPSEPFDGYFLVPQVQIGAYRVDFILGEGRHPQLLRSVAIECDGYDFHDRTPEMAARDKARDRFLNQKVKAVVRITGREIYRDVDSCMADALRVLFRDGPE